MKRNELSPLKGTECVVWVDVRQPNLFHYQGKVLQVTDSLLTLLDHKTGTTMSWPIASIVGITQTRGGQQ